MDKLNTNAQKMHDFFEKYMVPKEERIEILKIMKSGDELLARLALPVFFKGKKEEYEALLKEKFGELNIGFGDFMEEE